MLVNHTLYPQPEYKDHSPDKYEDFVQNGGRYGFRAIAAFDPDNFFQLDPELEAHLYYARQHFSDIGLATADDDHIVWDTSPEVAHDFHGEELSVYLFDRTINGVRPDPKRLAATQAMGNKNSFIRWAKGKNFQIPDTYVFEDGLHPSLDSLIFPAFVKAAESSNGKGIYKEKNMVRLIRAMSRVGSSYQVQQSVPEVVESASVQYEAVDGQAVHLASTDQLVNKDHSHAGNIHPPRFDARNATQEVADTAAALGLSGVFGLDVVVTQDDEVYLIECNPRYTGATYPTLVAARLGIQEWLACGMRTKLDGPEDIDFKDLAYDPASKIGVILVNNALIDTGHKQAGVLIAGPKEIQQEIKRDFDKLLNPKYAAKAA